MNMICDICKVERLVNDFINNQKYCFRCVYQKKMEKPPENRTKSIVLCRMCGKRVIRKKNIKKRQRTVFCSQECAQIGHKEMIDNHWTRKIRCNENSFTEPYKNIYNPIGGKKFSKKKDQNGI